MEGTKPRTASSLGMFDLLKGVGMLLIVFAHTSELYPVGDISTITPVTFFLFAYRESLMAAFYIASGYGFRKRSIGKCISQQFKTLFKPYAYTGLATTIAHFVIHYKTFGNWNNAVYETYKVLGGFVLGLPHTATYFGQEFFLRPHVVSAGADDRMDPAGHHPEYFPRELHKMGRTGHHAAGLGHLSCVGGPVLHRAGHGIAALPLHRLSGQEAPPV